MAFDPTTIDEDQCGEGHLDETPLYRVLLALQAESATGRLSVSGPLGQRHLFIMRGQPVGVALAEVLHPLGQLLLELGHIDSDQFVEAQRRIVEADRLAAQVYKEMQVVDEATLKEVFALQARRKLEHFCRLRHLPFVFGRGLTFLSGFHAVPLHMDAVVFIALGEAIEGAEREAWLASIADQEVGAAGDPSQLLPAPLEAYGFGAAEQRLLDRLCAGHEPAEQLANTGPLPRPELAVLLMYLDLLGRLEVREPAAAALLDALEGDGELEGSGGPGGPSEASGDDDTFARSPKGPGSPQTPRPANETPPLGVAAPRVLSVAAAATVDAEPWSPSPSGRGAAPSAASAGGAGTGRAAPPAEEAPPARRKGRRLEAEPSRGSKAISVARPEKTRERLPSIVVSAELLPDLLDF